MKSRKDLDKGEDVWTNVCTENNNNKSIKRGVENCLLFIDLMKTMAVLTGKVYGMS